MNPAISRQYYSHIARARRAEELKTTLEQLYGSDNWPNTFKHAFLDKAINREEIALLREFYPI